MLTRDRDKLVGDRTRLSNRLTAILKAYYPAALELFSAVAQPITLSFLRKYPTYDDARKTSFAKFKRFLSENRYPQPKRAAGIYEKLQQPHLECEDMLVRTKSRLMLTTVSQLQILMDEIKSYEKEIEKLLRSHPDAVSSRLGLIQTRIFSFLCQELEIFYLPNSSPNLAIIVTDMKRLKTFKQNLVRLL